MDVSELENERRAFVDSIIQKYHDLMVNGIVEEVKIAYRSNKTSCNFYVDEDVFGDFKFYSLGLTRQREIDNRILEDASKATGVKLKWPSYVSRTPISKIGISVAWDFGS